MTIVDKVCEISSSFSQHCPYNSIRNTYSKEPNSINIWDYSWMILLPAMPLQHNTRQQQHIPKWRGIKQRPMRGAVTDWEQIGRMHHKKPNPATTTATLTQKTIVVTFNWNMTATYFNSNNKLFTAATALLHTTSTTTTTTTVEIMHKIILHSRHHWHNA